MTAAVSRVQIESVKYFKVHPLQNPEAVVVEADTNTRFLTNDRPLA